MVNVEVLSPDNMIMNKDGLISAYYATYSAPPYNEPLTAAQEFGAEIIENGQNML